MVQYGSHGSSTGTASTVSVATGSSRLWRAQRCSASRVSPPAAKDRPRARARGSPAVPGAVSTVQPRLVTDSTRSPGVEHRPVPRQQVPPHPEADVGVVDPLAGVVQAVHHQGHGGDGEHGEAEGRRAASLGGDGSELMGARCTGRSCGRRTWLALHSPRTKPSPAVP